MTGRVYVSVEVSGKKVIFHTPWMRKRDIYLQADKESVSHRRHYRLAIGDAAGARSGTAPFSCNLSGTAFRVSRA